MKTHLSIIFLTIQLCVLGQSKISTASFSNFVNPPTFNSSLINLETKSQVRIEYTTFGLDISCTVIKQNIRQTLNWMVDEGMIPYVAQNYTKGGTWESRIQLANRIVYDIIMNRNPIIGDHNADFLQNEPFAQDWELFSFVNRLPNERSSILESNDTTIPINIISNHPLLLVNGIRNPEIISTSKSIRIK